MLQVVSKTPGENVEESFSHQGNVIVRQNGSHTTRRHQHKLEQASGRLPVTYNALNAVCSPGGSSGEVGRLFGGLSCGRAAA